MFLWIVSFLTTVAGASLTVVGIILWHWQVEQDKEQDKIQRLFNSFIDVRTELVKNVHQESAAQNATINSILRRMDRYEVRIGYIERSGQSSRNRDADGWLYDYEDRRAQQGER